MNLRHHSRANLETAKSLLLSDSDDNLLFAALKLRIALESLTYDRARGFAEDLGPDVMRTWQPRQLMQKILEVDPLAFSDATLSVGLEPSPGETPASMEVLGTDRALSMKTLKKHYDALGSFLHAPTIAQIEQGQDHDFEKLRNRCIDIVQALETVFSSTVWNSTIAHRGETQCQGCGTTIRRRLNKGKTDQIVECWSCSASYSMIEESDRTVCFTPRQMRVSCAQTECGGTAYIWERDFKLGNTWNCHDCGSKLMISLGVSVDQRSTA